MPPPVPPKVPLQRSNNSTDAVSSCLGSVQQLKEHMLWMQECSTMHAEGAPNHQPGEDEALISTGNPSQVLEKAKRLHLNALQLQHNLSEDRMRSQMDKAERMRHCLEELFAGGHTDELRSMAQAGSIPDVPSVLALEMDSGSGTTVTADEFHKELNAWSEISAKIASLIDDST